MGLFCLVFCAVAFWQEEERHELLFRFEKQKYTEEDERKSQEEEERAETLLFVKNEYQKMGKNVGTRQTQAGMNEDSQWMSQQKMIKCRAN